jgi:hypothetical protein
MYSLLFDVTLLLPVRMHLLWVARTGGGGDTLNKLQSYSYIYIPKCTCTLQSYVRLFSHPSSKAAGKFEVVPFISGAIVVFFHMRHFRPHPGDGNQQAAIVVFFHMRHFRHNPGDGIPHKAQ